MTVEPAELGLKGFWTTPTQILAEPAWASRLSKEDRRGLTARTGGRPGFFPAGSSGSSFAHWAFVRSCLPRSGS